MMFNLWSSISSWFADGMLHTVHWLAMKWCDSFPASPRMLATWWSCKRGICRWGSGKGERENERKTMITKTYDYPPGNKHIPLFFGIFQSMIFLFLPGYVIVPWSTYAFGIEAMVLDGHGKKGHVVSGALKALICLAGYTPTVCPVHWFLPNACCFCLAAFGNHEQSTAFQWLFSHVLRITQRHFLFCSIGVIALVRLFYLTSSPSSSRTTITPEQRCVQRFKPPMQYCERLWVKLPGHQENLCEIVCVLSFFFWRESFFDVSHDIFG